MSPPRAVAAVLLLLLLGGACTTTARPSPEQSPSPRAATPSPVTAATTTEPPLSGRLIVFAASSLTESFTAAAAAFERRWPATSVELSFAGSPTLVTQVLNGAPGGVVALADTATMARLQRAGAVDPPVVFARNTLAIVVPRENPLGITGLADLTRPGLLVGLGGPSVPVGAYARQAFAKAGLDLPEASQEQDVKAIVTKVALGELDAGIVYASDVRAGAGRVQAVAVPDAVNVVATYSVAVVHEGANRSLAGAFVAFLRSDAGQRLLTGFGFLPAG